ncbi:MAG TPA: hypothetical protein VN327_14990 [Pseudonocardiaceae bacterium]|nr:hypothetical protein [Pseudonocardiaceae bacterium]
MSAAPAHPVVTRVATENFTFQDVDIPAGAHIALARPVSSRPHVGITGSVTLPLRFTGTAGARP